MNNRHLFTKGVVTVRAKWDVQNTNLEQNCAGGFDHKNNLTIIDFTRLDLRWEKTFDTS